MGDVPKHLQQLVDTLLSESGSDEAPAPASSPSRPLDGSRSQHSSRKRNREHKHDSKSNKRDKQHGKHRKQNKPKRHDKGDAGYDYQQHDFKKGLQMQIDYAKTGRRTVLDGHGAERAKGTTEGMSWLHCCTLAGRLCSTATHLQRAHTLLCPMRPWFWS